MLILAAFLGFAGVALDRAYRSSGEVALRDNLQAHVYMLLAAAEEGANGRMEMPQDLPSPAFNRPESGLYAVVTSGTAGYDWRSASLLGLELPRLTPMKPGVTHFRLAGDFAVLQQGISWEDDSGNLLNYAVSIAADRSTLNQSQTRFRLTLWRWLGGVSVILLFAQLLLLRWGLRPLHAMSDAVRSLEQGEMTRIDGPLPGELEGLGQSLNALIDHDERRQARVRNSLADLAHSLKTPLSVLRGAAGNLNDAALTGLITEQTGRIDDIVSYQRQRAAVAGRVTGTRPTALQPIIRRIAASLDKTEGARDVDCVIEMPDGLQLRADQGDLFELFGNLLENAYRHAAGQVLVSGTEQQSAIIITIDDDGPGFDQSEAQRLMQRGQRADQHHPGEGIGLAVASEIMRQYGGEISIQASRTGGARILLRFDRKP
jgi:two-component system sensor histidine kinase PhoQ